MPYYAEECASMLGVTFSSGIASKRDIVSALTGGGGGDVCLCGGYVCVCGGDVLCVCVWGGIVAGGMCVCG